MAPLAEQRENPEFHSPVFDLAKKQFEMAAQKLELTEDMANWMINPERALMVSIPTRMDDGSIKTFYGYRVQHSTVLGPGKGGVRFHPNVNLGEVTALATWMTWKGGLMNIPLGGAKGGVRCNPRELSALELENLTRRYTAGLFPIIGPERDIPAPDVGTNPQVMAWMMDTYSMQKGFNNLGIVTGKPQNLGGSQGRLEATGRGVAQSIAYAAQTVNLPLENATVAVQGFGNVGYYAARFLQSMGAKIIAVSNSLGGVHNKNGIPVEPLNQHQLKDRDLSNFSDTEKITNARLLSMKCDILVLAALENQVNEKNAPKVNCKIYAEGANGPTSLEADKILEDKGIFILPDILCNSGGVVVSYFEWVQGLQGFFWDEYEIFKRMNKIMKNAFDETYALTQRQQVGMRTAALMLGVRRVADAMQLRGLNP